jgi:N-acetylglucosaminyldiphosphoundecaprenol N-acetyl-beta-D-mannosaminyltransferase
LSIRKILIDGIEYYGGEFNEFTDYILTKYKSNHDGKIIIVHINLKNFYSLCKDKELKEKIKNECTCVFDGIGMKTGIMLRGKGKMQDLNGTDLYPVLINEFCRLGYGIFLLGAEEHIVKKAVKKISGEYPEINICGYSSGYFSEEEESGIIKKINESKSDILIIGRGFPLQEKFILKHKDNLNVSLIWNVGGLLDFISGKKKRAPLWLRKIRLEWLYRLALEPGRMIHRNTVAAFYSLFHIIFYSRIS